MCAFIQNLTGGYRSSAKVVDGTLVLSLPDAQSPIVWRMDLNTAKSSAIEVRENDDNKYDLMLKTSKADAHVIGTYEFKIKATQALMAVTKAMRKAEGQMPVIPMNLSEEDRARYLPVPLSRPRSTTFGGMVLRAFKYLIILACLVVVLGTGWTYFEMKERRDISINQAAKETAELGDSAPAHKKIGEVMSADDFLKGL